MLKYDNTEDKDEKLKGHAFKNKARRQDFSRIYWSQKTVLGRGQQGQSSRSTGQQEVSDMVKEGHDHSSEGIHGVQ